MFGPAAVTKHRSGASRIPKLTARPRCEACARYIFFVFAFFFFGLVAMACFLLKRDERAAGSSSSVTGSVPVPLAFAPLAIVDDATAATARQLKNRK